MLLSKWPPLDDMSLEEHGQPIRGGTDIAETITYGAITIASFGADHKKLNYGWEED